MRTVTDVDLSKLAAECVVRREDIEYRPSFMDLMMKHFREKSKENSAY